MNFLKDELLQSPYGREIEVVLPRIFALCDVDALSPTLGIADRQYWAWKLIDFPNATFQGTVHGLSLLLERGLFSSNVSEGFVLDRIGSMINAVGRITRGDGSLEEAFPHERSYCVTALIAFDILKALSGTRTAEFLTERVDVEAILTPLLSFLKKGDETHGLISNHLATAAAALLLWHERTGDDGALAKGEKLIQRIMKHYSSEGWFEEYAGADPGYQTLCLSHLVECHSVRPNAELWQAMVKSLEFTQYFVHPDGSFGGIYGSRSTRVFYPAGIEALAKRVPLGAAIAKRMRGSIAAMETVPLRAIDQPNLMPLFNNYCAAIAVQQAAPSGLPAPDLPAFTSADFVRRFPAAGLIAAKRGNLYTIVSTRKGGVAYHWDGQRQSRIDCGLVVEDFKGQLFHSQSDRKQNEIEVDEARGFVTVKGDLKPYSHPLPNGWNFVLLRLMTLSLMRIPPINAFIKQRLAWLLMGQRRGRTGTFQRSITLWPQLRITDHWTGNYKRVEVTKPFNVVHMASQGYWQASDSGREGQL